MAEIRTFSRQEMCSLARQKLGQANYKWTWPDAHDEALACWKYVSIQVFTSNRDYGNAAYRCCRVYLTFNTASLGAGSTVLSATLLMNTPDDHPFREPDPGYSDVHIVEGVQHYPVVMADFGAELLKTTSGGVVLFEDLSHAGSEITLNPTGIGWINKTGLTKFCLRLAGEKDNTIPTGFNYVFIGNAHLKVTYAPIVPPFAINRAHALSREEL